MNVEYKDLIKKNMNKYVICSCKNKKKLKEKLNDLLYHQEVLISYQLIYKEKEGYTETNNHDIIEAYDEGFILCSECGDELCFEDEDDVNE